MRLLRLGRKNKIRGGEYAISIFDGRHYIVITLSALADAALFRMLS